MTHAFSGGSTDVQDWAEGVSNHFIVRARERMNCTCAEARLIGAGVLWAISQERWDLVRFVTRVSRDGKRVFRFRHAGTGKFWYALVNTQDMTCVTLLPPHYTVGREGKTEIQLKDINL